jgi:septum formation protein
LILVYFDDLDDETIAAYVATGDPMDKAGSYGIQSIASSFVTKLSGCYFNVVGFPIHRFTKELLSML